MKRQAHAKIDWHDESTWTLDALSNWTAQRDLLSTSAVDAACSDVRKRYAEQYMEYVKDVPDWALQVTSRVLMAARVKRSLSESGLLNWNEQEFINLVKALYGGLTCE